MSTCRAAAVGLASLDALLADGAQLVFAVGLRADA